MLLRLAIEIGALFVTTYKAYIRRTEHEFGPLCSLSSLDIPRFREMIFLTQIAFYPLDYKEADIFSSVINLQIES